jgi:hypothetical protein
MSRVKRVEMQEHKEISKAEMTAGEKVTQTTRQAWAARSRGLMSLAGKLGQYLGRRFSLAQREWRRGVVSHHDWLAVLSVLNVGAATRIEGWDAAAMFSTAAVIAESRVTTAAVMAQMFRSPESANVSCRNWRQTWKFGDRAQQASAAHPSRGKSRMREASEYSHTRWHRPP